MPGNLLRRRCSGILLLKKSCTDSAQKAKKNRKKFVVVAPIRPHKLLRPWSQIIGTILVSSDRSHVTSGHSSGYAAAAGFVSQILMSGPFCSVVLF
jgi:hypothetical protein